MISKLFKYLYPSVWILLGFSSGSIVGAAFSDNLNTAFRYLVASNICVLIIVVTHVFRTEVRTQKTYRLMQELEKHNSAERTRINKVIDNMLTAVTGKAGRYI